MKDPYIILGIAREADADAIKAAYRALLNKYHPDKASNESAGIEKFFEIVAAWESLSDSRSHSPVDRDGAANPHSTPYAKEPPTRSAFSPSSAESPAGARSADRASMRAAYSPPNGLREEVVSLVIYGVGGVVFGLLALVFFG